MKPPRSEVRNDRIRTIFRLMVSGQWTPSSRAALREKWGVCKREWEKCCESAKAAVQAEIEFDKPTKDLLLAGVQETLSSILATASTAQRAAAKLQTMDAKGDAKLSPGLMTARLLDCSSRAQQTALGYWQLLLGNTDKADALPSVPPADLLEMIAEQMRRKGGQRE